MAAVSNEVFAQYRKLCEERWGIKIVEKSESKLMKAVAAILFFNKGFLTDYITTIGTTIYWPKASEIRSMKDFGSGRGRISTSLTPACSATQASASGRPPMASTRPFSRACRPV